MRITSGRSWASQFCLHKSPGQVGSDGTPVTKELTGLFRTDGERPDGLTLVPCRAASLYAGT